ncbi:SPOR domain-containing protein [Desulfuromonas carbonis]|uniref:SPOR domain-containing protein n=1 Tax=Desulfuromonas sp. DDH964 TaxID=1823759 RepID=UPI00078E1331|nr:SPOR domain-containing protein [Desulfuromonas sp. DDH964]AMV71590.1 SPOR domain-containing protein [Desulfuromonas sp. DDH964]
MNRQVHSRSERRMERKQVLVLLLLVIGVGLGCFALGVMVGRSAAPAAPALEAVATPPARIPVAVAPPAADSQGKDAPPAEGTTAPASLTFYDNLPRGDQPPLGSGINLPPAAAEPPPAPAATVAAPPRTAPAPPAPVSRPAAKEESYLVQVASFARPDDAGVLQARLAKKGFEAFVQQADLGSKGVWYRVFVGPLAGADAAEGVAARLKAEEKLSPLVRKR